jgi:hypothetical protein
MTDPGAAPANYQPPDLEPVRRARPQTRYGGASLYVEPDPVRVAKLWHSHGWQAVLDRYFWKGHTELQNIRIVGEERLATSK